MTERRIEPDCRPYREPGLHARICAIDQENGAQGRDRTTDTAIFSRMLYQLSYLGTSGHGGLGAAVYSQAGKPCPPRFALRATRGAATQRPKDAACPASPEGRRRTARNNRGTDPKSPKMTLIVGFLIVLAAGDRVGIRQPAVQVDLPAALRTEGPGGLNGRFAADRARPGAALAGTGLGWRLSWHSTSRSEPETLRRREA